MVNYLSTLKLIISSDRGSTALYVASQNNHIEVVKELINYKANPDGMYKCFELLK